MSRQSQVGQLSLLGGKEAPVGTIDPFNLLGQKEHFPVAVLLRGNGEPELSIAWSSFHQNFLSELVVFFQWTRVPKGDAGADVFRDCQVQRRVPARAVAAAALWHVVFFIVPWPALPGGARRNPALENTQLTWYGPIDDLPLLNVPKHAPKPKATKAQKTAPPADAVEAYHPRQRIYTDPVQPTHPRQTLVRPAAPMEAPKFLPALPNMVQLAAQAGPARPRLQISEQALAKLRPKQPKHTAAADALPSEAPNLETRPADLSLTAVASKVERPKLEINAGSAPRLAQQSDKGEALSAPEVSTGTNGASETIIALSATPAPPTPVVEAPKGNLAARVAMSPEGKGTGNGGAGRGSANGSANGAGSGSDSPGAKNSIGISISGGSPKASAGMAGPAAPASPPAKLSLPGTHGAYAYKRPETDAADDPPARTGPPNFAALPPGAQPEQIFTSHRVYSLNVNMPNLNSVTGSWIIRFSELHLPGAPRLSGDLTGPVALRKIDPKYPQTAIEEHIQGEVILYAVIRPDGSVDSIQLVRGIDKQLDANAIAALSQWKFQPATKDGQPVPLEAIVHIPFRGPEPQ